MLMQLHEREFVSSLICFVPSVLKLGCSISIFDPIIMRIYFCIFAITSMLMIEIQVPPCTSECMDRNGTRTSPNPHSVANFCWFILCPGTSDPMHGYSIADSMFLF